MSLVIPYIKEYNGIGNAIKKLCDHVNKCVTRRVTRKNIKKVLRMLLKDILVYLLENLISAAPILALFYFFCVLGCCFG